MDTEPTKSGDEEPKKGKRKAPSGDLKKKRKKEYNWSLSKEMA